MRSVVLSLMLCCAAAAQDAPVFRSGVNDVLIPVIVRDQNGKPVADLERDRFVLRDSGKARKIEHFAVERRDGKAGEGRPTPALPADAPRRFVAYLFDDVDAAPNDLARARTAARRHLATVPPGDRAAIFTTSGTVAQEFTADRALLAKALDKLAPRSMRTGACPDISYYLASMYLDRHDRRAGSVIAGLVLQCTPNLPPQVLQGRVAMESKRALAEGERSARTVFQSIDGVVNRMARLPGPRSLVFASPGFTTLPSHQEEATLLDRAVRAGVAIHTLDMRGVYTAASEFERLEQSERGSILAELAEGTGGLRYRNDNDLGIGFETLAGAAEVEYLLGFASTAKDGRLHSIEVSVKDCGGCVVSARRNYYAPKPGESGAPPSVGMGAADVVDTPLELRIHPKDGGIAVTGYLDVNGLPFARNGAFYTRSVAVLFALFDWNGLLVKSDAKRFEFRLSEAEWALARKHGLPLSGVLDAAPGQYLVRVVVADSDRKVLASVTRAAMAP